MHRAFTRVPIALALSLFAIAFQTHAQTSCLLYPSNSPAPSGYAASWDVFDSAKALLVKSNCPTAGTNITMTVGKGDTTQYVWNEAYTYEGGWVKKILSGTTQSGGWIPGQATASITAPVSTSAASPLYFVGYVCTNRGTAGWKCGCANSACTTPAWQLQAYTGSIGSSVGTTGGTGFGGGDGNDTKLCYSTSPQGTQLFATPSTLQGQLNAANPGDWVILNDGTYSGNYTYAKNASGNLPITIKAAGNGAVITGTFNINGKYGVLKGMKFTGSGHIEINGSFNRITRNSFQNMNKSPIIEMRGGSFSDNRIDHNEFLHFSNAAVEMSLGGPNAVKHQNMRFDHNYFLDHVVTGSNESVMRMLTDAFHDAKLQYDYNLFDNVLQGATEPEIISLKTGGVMLRGNTIVNSNDAFSFRETNNSTAENNYFGGTTYLKVYGDNHVIRGNTFENGTLGIGSGNGTMDDLGSQSCQKYGLTALLPNCNTAHSVARNTEVYGNDGKILVGAYGNSIPALNTVLHNNSGPISFGNDQGTNNQGGALSGNNAHKLIPSEVGIGPADVDCSGN